MVESDAVVHHRDEHRRTPLGDGPGAREVDQGIVPGLKWIGRIVRYGAHRGCGRGGRRPEGTRRLIQPQEVIARHRGDRGILAQCRRDRLPLRGIRDADLRCEDRRGNTHDRGASGHRRGQVRSDRSCPRPRARSRCQGGGPRTRRTERGMSEGHDQLVRRSRRLRRRGCAPSRTTRKFRPREGRNSCTDDGVRQPRGCHRTHTRGERFGRRDDPADGPVPGNPPRWAGVSATPSQRERE